MRFEQLRSQTLSLVEAAGKFTDDDVSASVSQANVGVFFVTNDLLSVFLPRGL